MMFDKARRYDVMRGDAGRDCAHDGVHPAEAGAASAVAAADSPAMPTTPALTVEHLSFAHGQSSALGASDPAASGPAALGSAASDLVAADAPMSNGAVLRDVSFELPHGAFALLVGGTGSGKSTLLSLIKPEIAPAGTRVGDIRVDGAPIESLSPAESARRIGLVFQRPDNQIVCDTVWHEMAFGLENLGTPQAEMRRLVAETSYFFGMESWFRRTTDELSGGRKQLLALASTLVMKPGLLLLDEPTAQLDPIAEKNFLHALFRVNRELGCTVLVATHSPRAMVDYATCAFELVDGAIRPVDDRDSLRGLPRLLPDGGEVSADGDGSAAGDGAANGEVSVTADGAVAASIAVFGSRRAPITGGHPRVEVTGAWYRYARDGDWVMRGLDLRVAPGSVHALVGGNGCGKSTLLSAVAGIVKPQRGRVQTHTRAKALLPQDPQALFVAETALDELMEWSTAGAYTSHDAEVMLARLGLAAHSWQHPFDLSGGQQQLLALGKLLLLQPDLLLLDEPTKGLDLAARRMLARMLTQLRAGGATVLMATHDLDFAQQVADTVSMMFDGELACTVPAAEFFEGNVYYRP